MRSRIFLLTVLVFLILAGMAANADSKPIMVLSSIVFKFHDRALLAPEIAVNEDGTWRQATVKDLWVGQIFKTYTETNNPQLLGKVSIKSITKDLAYLKEKTGPGGQTHFWGIYSRKKSFSNKGIEKPIYPKIISQKAAIELLKTKCDKAFIESIIKADGKQIKNDFPISFDLTVKEYMFGDINGDKVRDYVIVLGHYYSGSKLELPGAVIIAYISISGQYQRLPINSWKIATDEYGWPQLLFMKDINGDGGDEIFVADADSDTSRPIVYSWFDNNLRMLYFGNELCQL